MKNKLLAKISDIQTGSEGLGKPKFVLNTVSHDKPIIPKLVLDSNGRWRHKLEILEVPIDESTKTND